VPGLREAGISESHIPALPDSNHSVAFLVCRLSVFFECLITGHHFDIGATKPMKLATPASREDCQDRGTPETWHGPDLSHLALVSAG
jgi:hypothetical protein